MVKKRSRGIIGRDPLEQVIGLSLGFRDCWIACSSNSRLSSVVKNLATVTILAQRRNHGRMSESLKPRPLHRCHLDKGRTGGLRESHGLGIERRLPCRLGRFVDG